MKNLPAPQNSIVCMTFHQAQTVVSTKTKRVTLYTLMRGFGGLIGFCTFMTSRLIAKMQSFSVTNSLVKKLYSVELDDDEKEEEAGGDLSFIYDN